MKSLLLIFSLSFLSSVAVAGPIHDAAREGDLQEVQRLINEGVNIDSKTKYEETALHIASDKGDIEMVKFLIAEGADVDARDFLKRTPLELTVTSSKGSLKIAKLLIKKGANRDLKDRFARRFARRFANTRNVHGETALHIASGEGDIEMVKFLIENGAVVDAQIISHQEMAFNYATEHGYSVNRHIKVNKEKDKHGKTALQIAKEKGHLKVAQILIENGAKVDVKKKLKALQVAKQIGYQIKHREIFSSLSFLNSVAVAELIYIAAETGNLQAIQNLVNKGMDINSKNKDGKTALHIASGEGHLEMVKFLIENGAVVDAGDKEGRTALEVTVTSPRGSLEIAKLLIKNGASKNIKRGGFVLIANARNAYGETALQIASGEGDLEMVKFLITEGADVNAQMTLNMRLYFQEENKYGKTALHFASEKNHFRVIQILLANGAKVDVKNEEGKTALQVAKQRGYKKTVSKLESFQAKASMNKAKSACANLF